jgi:hypothetical protein
MRSLTALTVIVSVVFLATAAEAAIILPPDSAGWEYTFTNPTADPTWNTTTGLGGIWSAGDAPFGNQSGGDPNFVFDTFWPADGSDGDDLWVRRAIDLSGWMLSSVQWDLGVDNGFKLYANGTLVGSANAEGYTFRWEYPNGQFGPGNSALVAGMNVIAVALEDHGGATAWDMQIRGERGLEAIPEPATLTLFGLGAATIASRRLRKAR